MLINIYRIFTCLIGFIAILFITINADGFTIDPSITLLTYLGGSGDDWVYRVEVDR